MRRSSCRIHSVLVLIQHSFIIGSEIIQHPFRTHSDPTQNQFINDSAFAQTLASIEAQFRLRSELILSHSAPIADAEYTQNWLETHPRSNQSSIRPPSELMQNPFWIDLEFMYDLFGIHSGLGIHSEPYSPCSELTQNLFRKRSAFIQNSFRIDSALARNSFWIHSELIQSSPGTHSESIQNSFRAHSEFIQNSFKTYS